VEDAYARMTAIAKSPPRVDAELHRLAIKDYCRVRRDTSGSETAGKFLRRREIARMAVPQHVFPLPQHCAGNMTARVSLALLLAHARNLDDAQRWILQSLRQPRGRYQRVA